MPTVPRNTCWSCGSHTVQVDPTPDGQPLPPTIEVATRSEQSPELDEARITEQATNSQDENVNAGQAESAPPSGIAPVAAAPKKKRGLGKKLGLGCGGVILVMIIMVIVLVLNTSFDLSFDNSSFSYNSSGTPVMDTAGPATTTFIDHSGTGPWTSHKFTAPSDWKLEYTYMCPRYVSSRTFQVSVLGAHPGSPTAGITESKKSGHGTTSLHDAQGDGIYLSVHSECDWNIKAYA